MIIIIDDDPMQRIIARHATKEFKDVLVPETPQEIDALPTDVLAVIADTEMFAEWVEARDRYLAKISPDIVFEWSATLIGNVCNRRLGNVECCESIAKTGSGRELQELITKIKSQKQNIPQRSKTHRLSSFLKMIPMW